MAGARNWKAYWTSSVRRFVRGRVVEVGAGLGANLAFLAGADSTSWTWIEPDPGMARALRTRAAEFTGAPRPTVVEGTLAALAPDARADTVLYIDVLEHIADDRGELARAAAILAPGGNLVVLCPAFDAAFSAFDAAIGHLRRYTRGALRALTPPHCAVVAAFYLDSLGLALSLANRLLLREAMPGPRQIAFWDRVVVPASRAIDPLVGRGIGRSVVVVWRRAED